MAKYCLYDKRRKEYVIKEGRTVIGDRIVYETSSEPAQVTEIVSQPITEETLRKLEKGLELEQGQLACHCLNDKENRQIERQKKLKKVRKSLEEYLDEYSQSQSDVKELAAEFCYVLGEYFIDSDNDGLLESLENNDWDQE